MKRLRVALLADLLEEGWPSMDLVAQMLFEAVAAGADGAVTAELVRPPLRRRLSRVAGIRSRRAWNADRMINRFHDYPAAARRLRGRFDVYHVVDHSYAQLVHALPAGRAVVTCHDLDAFRSLLRPREEPRSALFRAMAARTRDGLAAAARVICVSAATRDELVAAGIVPAARTVVIPNGVHPSCSPDPDARTDAEVAALLGPASCQNPELLHVGSTVPRKRIDLLLSAFSAIRRRHPSVRLVRVGGAFTAEQERLVAALGVGDAVRVLPFLSRPALAAVYRRAALVLQPSEREGFGLPVIEALACGAPVLASDLDVMREVGGDAVSYAAAGDADAWEAAIALLLEERSERPDDWETRRRAGLARSEKFSWLANARRTLEVYREVVA